MFSLEMAVQKAFDALRAKYPDYQTLESAVQINLLRNFLESQKETALASPDEIQRAAQRGYGS